MGTSYQNLLRTVIKPDYLPFIQTIKKETAGRVEYAIIYNVLAELKLSGCTFGSYQVCSVITQNDPQTELIRLLRNIAYNRPYAGFEFLKGVERENVQKYNFATDYPFLQSISTNIRDYLDSIDHIAEQPTRITTGIVEKRMYEYSLPKRRYL